ncbi:MAG TPA: DUF2249 domain-containing protein [Thermomicrobiales bacterium]|nr:DUF2249 domain-containing protein [Thermomicrobiales bacterium]
MSGEPIEVNWTIHRVLERYPDVLEELIATSPAFGKLRNPLMRKVQSRLVTVEQAARIGGVTPEALLARLNQEAGLEVPAPVVAPDPRPRIDAEPPDWLDSAEVTRMLNVRPIMERGEEPYKVIMSIAREVQPGEVLRLLVGFEPVPLYDTLGRKGFSAWARPLAADCWQVDFHRDRVLVDEDTTAERGSTEDLDWERVDAEVTIDVSELVPPEPMVKILETLAAMPDGSTLLVHHVRRPIHLYARLDEMGYPHRTQDLGPDRVEVLIRKPRAEAS